jgi:hypothetical protein
MTEADENRAAGVWPARPMNPFEPLPPTSPARRSGARLAFQIAGKVIVALVLLSGVAYLLARATP